MRPIRHSGRRKTSQAVPTGSVAQELRRSFPTVVSKVLRSVKASLIRTVYSPEGQPLTNATKVINFDCVGNGDILTFASTKNTEIIGALQKAFGEAGQNLVRKRSAMIFLSDHANFKNSVMVSYTKKSLIGLLYLPLIHTGKDKVCDIDRINRLTEDMFAFARDGKI